MYCNFALALLVFFWQLNVIGVSGNTKEVELVCPTSVVLPLPVFTCWTPSVDVDSY